MQKDDCFMQFRRARRSDAYPFSSTPVTPFSYPRTDMRTAGYSGSSQRSREFPQLTEMLWNFPLRRRDRTGILLAIKMTVLFKTLFYLNSFPAAFLCRCRLIRLY